MILNITPMLTKKKITIEYTEKKMGRQLICFTKTN